MTTLQIGFTRTLSQIQPENINKLDLVLKKRDFPCLINIFSIKHYPKLGEKETLT